MRNLLPLLLTLQSAALRVANGDEADGQRGLVVEELEVPTVAPTFCSPIPANWTLRFNPNTTVGYSPTWYEFGTPGVTQKPSLAPVPPEETESPSDSPVEKPTSKPTEGPTEEPTDKPTARPTSKPTQGPTEEPTDKPTSKPTSKPTDKPTSKPTDKPTSKPSNKPTDKPCVSGGVQLVKQGGTIAYTSLPITVVKQTGSTVEVQIKQVWKADGTISWISTRFVDATQNKLVCPKKNEVAPGAVDYSTGSVEASGVKYGQTFTAKCVDGVANIEVYVHDGSGPFKSQPIIWVPPECSPSKDSGNKIGYNFTVPCSASCPGQPTGLPTLSPTYSPTKKPTIQPTARPTMAPTAKKAAVDCPVVTLDFETLTPGQYVTTELKATYGVTLKGWSGKNAYTPNGAVHVLDTGNKYAKEDTMHMSPNSGCGGMGVGGGGAPTSTYANCIPLGNIILVQDNSTRNSYVKANVDISYISFTFDEPINLEAVVFAEALGKKASSYKLTKVDKSIVNVTQPVGGQNGVVRTVMGDKGKGITAFTVTIPNLGGIAAIEYTWCVPPQAPTPAPTMEGSQGICKMTHLDFENVKPGTYLKDQLMKQFQVQVLAKGTNGGYTPNFGSAMVMDSRTPSAADPDLGSPNDSCGGPGKGDGGKVGSKYQNCEPLGNIVFVQQSDKAEADNLEGQRSQIIFRFNGTVTLHRFTLLDVDGPYSVQTVVMLDSGKTTYIYTPPTGDNGVVSVKVQLEQVREIQINFPSGGAIADVDYTMCKLMETPAPTYSPECPDVLLDFNILLPGSYIADELWDDYGIRFATESSGGGYRPNNAARVFDTSNPGMWNNGSPDIGSPNQACGGPGIGQGGLPGTVNANCEPLGNALIIQADSKVAAPMYYKKDASKIKIYFKVPAWVLSITMIVGDGCKQVTLTVYQEPYRKTLIYSPAHVEPNGVYVIPVGLHEVARMEISMPLGGALADITYTWCPMDTKAPTLAPVKSGTARPTKKPTVKVPSALPPTMMPIPYTTDCEMTILNFEGQPRGQYITNQFYATHGVTISAKSWNGGYAPNGAARIFDTSNPGIYGDGDPDLGSPNETCDPPGPGIGDGGKKGSDFENCEPLGNILVVQESLKATPSDHEYGSEITFKFAYPAFVDSAQIIDNDGCNCDPVRFTFTLSDGKVVTRSGASATGNNGVAWIYLNVERVVKVAVYFPLSGGISSLNYILCWPGP